jgi:hypothetical protein
LETGCHYKSSGSNKLKARHYALVATKGRTCF